MLKVYGGTAGSAAMLKAVPGDEVVARCLAVWQSVGLSERPRVERFPRKMVPFSAVYGELFDTDSNDDLDAVVLVEQRRGAPLHNLRNHIPLSLLPVIDIGGSAGHFADVHFDLSNETSWIETAKCILEFRARRAILRRACSRRPSFRRGSLRRSGAPGPWKAYAIRDFPRPGRPCPWRKA
jgi:hypothetical protein